MKKVFLAVLALGLLVSACGNEAAVQNVKAVTGETEVPSEVTAVTVTISPLEVELAPNAKQTFKATVEGAEDTGVTWSVEETDGGAISAEGVYTAPSNEGIYHVVAASTADASATARATVSVKAASGGGSTSGLTISPSSATVEIEGQLKLSASLDGTGLKGNEVEWTVASSAHGWISNGGNYTAPVTPGSYTVTATLVADSAKKASIKITVKAPAINVVIWPAFASVETGGSKSFAAAISGSAFNELKFSVQEGTDGGYITSTGLYTAPITPGTYHVLATSTYNGSKKAVATVTVHDVTPVVSIDPVKAGVLVGESFDFTATVTNTRFTGYEFSLPDADSGSISETGEYMAPATPGTYRVVVSSTYDNAVSATATVIVAAPYCPTSARVVEYKERDENNNYPETTFYARMEYSAYPTQESHVQLSELGIIGLSYYAHAVTRVDIAVGPGEDGIWETSDDELGFRYKLMYDSNGKLIRYAEMVSGPDGKIGTADDVETGGQVFWWDGAYLRVSALYTNLGIDGDNVANGEITEVWKYKNYSYAWRPQQNGFRRYVPNYEHHFTSPGPDGIWDLDECVNCGEDDAYTSYEFRSTGGFSYIYSGSTYGYQNTEFPSYQRYYQLSGNGDKLTYYAQHYFTNNIGIFGSYYYRITGNGSSRYDGHMYWTGSYSGAWLNNFYLYGDTTYYAQVRTCP